MTDEDLQRAVADDLRNYPSPWWVLWLQRALLIAVGVWSAAQGAAWWAVAPTVLFLGLHTWMIHRFRQEKAARDAQFAEIMRRIED